MSGRKSDWRRWIPCIFWLVCVLCSSAQKTPVKPPAAPATASVVVRLSRSVTCTGLHGPYVHAWVTVRDVQARRDQDGSWQNLTPDLLHHPLQLDLMAASASDEGRALGGNPHLPTGRYSAIRVVFNAPAASPERLCTADAPCVTLQSGGMVPLLLSPQAADGVLLGADRIFGGGWTVRPKARQQLTLMWNACASILPESNGQFRLTPVLRAAPGSFASASITGRIVDASNGQSPMGGNIMIALETPDRAGIDRVLMTTNAGADGAFTFPSVPEKLDDSQAEPARRDLVIAAISGMNAAYAPVVVSGVTAGARLGAIELASLPARNTAPAALFGEVRDAGATESMPSSVMVSALLPAATDSGATAVTVPLMQQGQAIASVLVTSNPLSCPPGIACGRYTLSVPAEGVQLGVWHPELERVVWLQEPSASTTYTVEATRAAAASNCEITQSVEIAATPGSLHPVPLFDLPACP